MYYTQGATKEGILSLLVLFDVTSGWVYLPANRCGGGEQVTSQQLSPNNPQGSAGTAATKVI